MPSPTFKPPARKARYIDLNFSFLENPLRHDISVLTDADAVKQSVLNLVRTQFFERPFHPEIGSNVTALLFEQLTPVTAQQLKYHIQQVVTNFEPRVKLSTIDVIVDYENNGFSVSITFYILNISVPVTVDVFLERLR